MILIIFNYFFQTLNKTNFEPMMNMDCEKKKICRLKTRIENSNIWVLTSDLIFDQVILISPLYSLIEVLDAIKI